ncbi:MAG: 16S rRNA (guanine(527)-N(7))-methyltransferase RsmG [Acidaminococcus sp.]|jgi:16S rRNA (guanine527-N7)-methyltransferase|nr:16S rRNA (guanine(527)-N(7))-methyltransferase RsmG [Acidaminococcus sp.]MCI2115392.1 16S rRNA (guanine(527)-N(7))-methyltransferase RsmG [Acidaminococcus sp.]MCI2117488.1 16S rRNA (guanine(527)-N(7))-methyltransferase RsmG [Acidaminococcus sp.]
MSYLETLRQGMDAIGCPLSEEQEARFIRYEEMLLETNKSLNLTAITDPDEVALKHMVDSLTVYDAKRFHNRTIADVGTGAGFPGLPLKIYDTTMRLTLIDSLAKRLHFLENVVQELGLGQVRCCHARAEEAGRDPKLREKFDVVVARAVAPMPVLAEYCLPLVRVGGVFYAMKGSKGMEETEEGRQAISILGGKIVDIRHLTLPGLTDKRYIITVEKIKPTSSQYPRRPGVASKKPLAVKVGAKK